jgi:Domain of unknown function (DUF4157)/Effector protein
VQGAGQPLSAEQRATYEPLFSHDFGRVRVFADDHAASAQHALAFASGSDIVLSGRINPASEFGQEVLMHELAHTVQYERFGKPKLHAQRTATHNHSDPGDASELEAHRAARSVLMGQPASISTAPSGSVSRWPDFLDDAWTTGKQMASGIATVGEAIWHEGGGAFSDMKGAVQREQVRDTLGSQYKGREAELEEVAQRYVEVNRGQADAEIGATDSATPEEKQQRRQLALKGLMQEGGEGIRDLGGAVDRQAAQEELSAQFEQVSEDSSQPLASHQLKPSQLQEMARTYSDVRLGRADDRLGAQPGEASESVLARRMQALEGMNEEGLEGARDVAGAVDRQRAQDELENRFNIVSDDPGAAHLPNDLTAEGFRNVARMYSDVRLKRGDLRVDGSELNHPALQHSAGMNAQTFEAGAMNDIATMLQTSSGRDEVWALQHNALPNPRAAASEGLYTAPDIHHTTTIRPVLNGQAGDAQASAAPGFHDVDGNLRPDGRPGQGVNAEARYVPNASVGSQPGLNPWEPMRSDVVLFHELRHSLDYTHGTLDDSFVNESDARVLGTDEQGRPDPNNVSMDHDIMIDARAGQFNMTVDPTRRNRSTKRREHAAIGLGKFSDAPLTENEYRAERNEIGENDADSSLPGDADMARRRRHNSFDDPDMELEIIRELNRRTSGHR